MKNFNFLGVIKALFLGILLIGFNGCQKQTNSIEDNLINIELAKQAKVYLENQKIYLNSTRNTKIDLLISSLDFDNLYTEDIREQEKVIIIPFNANSQKTNTANNKSISSLLLVLNKQNKIRKGNIIEYQYPEEQSTNRLPKDLFHNFYTLKNWNGKLTFATITNHLLFEIEYRNDKLFSLAETKIKEENNTSNGRTNDCKNWYLVTTYYYPDGSTSQTWEFLYTSCEGTWEDFQSDALNNPGGNEELDSNPITWIVAENQAVSWIVMSVEKFKGIKKNTEPQGGYFTSISHVTSSIEAGTSSTTWHPSPAVVSYEPQLAKASLGGQIHFSDGSTTTISYKTKAFPFSQIFP